MKRSVKVILMMIMVISVSKVAYPQEAFGMSLMPKSQNFTSKVSMQRH